MEVVSVGAMETSLSDLYRQVSEIAAAHEETKQPAQTCLCFNQSTSGVRLNGVPIKTEESDKKWKTANHFVTYTWESKNEENPATYTEWAAVIGLFWYEAFPTLALSSFEDENVKQAAKKYFSGFYAVLQNFEEENYLRTATQLATDS